MTQRGCRFSTRLTSPAALPTSLMLQNAHAHECQTNSVTKGISRADPQNQERRHPRRFQKPPNVLDFLKDVTPVGPSLS